MKITDQHGADITNLLAPDDATRTLEPTKTNADNPSDNPSDNTFTDLCARHAAQHVTAHADLCAGNAPASATPLPTYAPTPGEEALNAALSMVAAHVDSALRAIGNLNERFIKIESQPHDGTE